MANIHEDVIAYAKRINPSVERFEEAFSVVVTCEEDVLDEEAEFPTLEDAKFAADLAMRSFSLSDGRSE